MCRRAMRMGTQMECSFIAGLAQLKLRRSWHHDRGSVHRTAWLSGFAPLHYCLRIASFAITAARTSANSKEPDHGN